MLLVIDNFDSFTYNLVQYFGQLGVEQNVFRNDEITVQQAVALNPDRILISPGPKTPDFAGVSLELIEAFSSKTPILGVCLGHQCIGQYFGGRIVQSKKLMHGKTSLIRHQGDGIFEGMDSPFPAARYHSLVLDPTSVPNSLQVIADTSEDEIMAVKHRDLPIWGVQFHPESLATDQGIRILQNFLNQ